MRNVAAAIVFAVIMAGCAGPTTEEPSPADPQPPPALDAPDLPPGRGALDWTSTWENHTGPDTQSVEPYGPFVADASLVLVAVGPGQALSLNLTTEAETILQLRATDSEDWKVSVLHHHHGATEDEAKQRMEALSTSWTLDDNGTMLDVYVDTADIQPTSVGAQTEVYVQIDVPPEREIALHLAAWVQVVRGDALQADVRDACVRKLSLEVADQPLRATIVPACSGDVRLVAAGGQVTARLEDRETQTFAGSAQALGGQVEVALRGVQFSVDDADRKEFADPAWSHGDPAVRVFGNAGAGGTLTLSGCSQGGCPGGD